MPENSEPMLLKQPLPHTNEFNRQPAISVTQVMQEKLLQCSPDTPLSVAAEMMSNSLCSSILVQEQGRVVGIWTEHDALHLDLNSPSTFSTPLHEVMSSPVLTVHLDDDLDEVAERFHRDHVRHYLVVNDGHEPVGVITQTDVVMNQGLEYYLRLRNIHSLIHSPPLQVEPSSTISQAAETMRKSQQTAVVARISGEYGILTERDIVRLIAERKSHLSVAECASHPLICVSSSTSVYRTRLILHERGLRHIGVKPNDSIDGNELLGLINLTDILTGVERLYIDELKDALEEREKALKLSSYNLQLAERVIANSHEGVMITNPQGIIENVNQTFTLLTGYSSKEAIGTTPALLKSGHHDIEFYQEMWSKLHKHDFWRGEVWNRRKNGEIFPEMLTISAIRDDNGKLTHYAGLFRDLTELKAKEDKIRLLAYYDPLTGLPNRQLFEDRLAVALAHAHRHASRTALLFIDLNHLKQINLLLGHDIGDKLLVRVGELFSDCLPEGDTLARIGGDEFVIIIEALQDDSQLGQLAHCLCNQLSSINMIDGKALSVTASIGVSIYPDDSDDQATLLHCADSAMRHARELGQNSYQFYSAKLNTSNSCQLSMESSLNQACAQGAFELLLEPVVDAETNLIAAAVSLHWRHPEAGLVSDIEFMPLAQQLGLTHSINEWLWPQLRLLCQQLEESTLALPLLFRVPSQLLSSANFIPQMETMQGPAGWGKQPLTLMLDKRSLRSESDCDIELLNQLHALGINLGLDNFTGGFCPLNLQKDLPLQLLRLDPLMVAELHQSPRDGKILHAVVNMAEALGMQVVAAGVELSDQQASLIEAGCELMQGPLFFGPMPVKQFIERLRQ